MRKMGAGRDDDGGGEEYNDNGGGESDRVGSAEVGGMTQLQGLTPPLRGKGTNCTGTSRRRTQRPTSTPPSAIASCLVIIDGNATGKGATGYDNDDDNYDGASATGDEVDDDGDDDDYGDGRQQ